MFPLACPSHHHERRCLPHADVLGSAVVSIDDVVRVRRNMGGRRARNLPLGQALADAIEEDEVGRQ
jgi:hypothetical protein